ncbi:bcl-2-like protein 15 isoform X2 [Grus americana]|uniref:bcl-2-like protein 15 isoform X2 n=1 Tax=Grus americana TaxID=9117 RepID=UPI00240890D0|nr:bcl-2-like protein 15 isoform X2 [Grus americana]
MATFEEQTECIVEALFSDLLGEDESACRSLETDLGVRCAAPQSEESAEELPTKFDPVVIASRLRQMGDRCNMDFESVSSEALAEVLKGKMEKFGTAVETLSQSWCDQNAELVYERAFLCVSVKLLTHVIKKVSATVQPIQLIKVINGNSRVRNHIEACGGWENLDN